MMHIVSKFQLFIRIFTVVKLENKTQARGKKRRFLPLFQSNAPQWINALQAPNLCQSNADYLVCHILKNIAISKTFNASKQ